MDYNDFLRISDEIELNKLATDLELTLLMNDKNMDHYDDVTSRQKVYELLGYIDRLQDLKNHAIAHGSNEVFDKCEIYIIDTEYQMNKLRNKYMY